MGVEIWIHESGVLQRIQPIHAVQWTTLQGIYGLLVTSTATRLIAVKSPRPDSK